MSPTFDFWRDDRLLVLKPVPGADLNNLHGDLLHRDLRGRGRAARRVLTSERRVHLDDEWKLKHGSN